MTSKIISQHLISLTMATFAYSPYNFFSAVNTFYFNSEVNCERLIPLLRVEQVKLDLGLGFY